MRRRNILSRKNSEAAFKSVSGFNRDMELMDTVIGHSMVKPHTAQQRDHQRVLCLDGGGMKVKSLACQCHAYYRILNTAIILLSQILFNLATFVNYIPSSNSLPCGY